MILQQTERYKKNCNPRAKICFGYSFDCKCLTNKDTKALRFVKIGWKECSLEGLMLIFNASLNANKGLIIILIICSLIQRYADTTFCAKQIYVSLQILVRKHCYKATMSMKSDFVNFRKHCYNNSTIVGY